MTGGPARLLPPPTPTCLPLPVWEEESAPGRALMVAARVRHRRRRLHRQASSVSGSAATSASSKPRPLHRLIRRGTKPPDPQPPPYSCPSSPPTLPLPHRPPCCPAAWAPLEARDAEVAAVAGIGLGSHTPPPACPRPMPCAGRPGHGVPGAMAANVAS
ncbi:hypothetical protein PVAP13_1KG002850 [Panicum virgatum]|uniref:Uncharacterized protein n=1 Tax=Panicum virgatum TaxID=38727 RepID=A0A8T0X8L9_PANVG|nr:hypothetical protein PVAP13_1KG002850 [Panicum virgatum]